MGIYIKGMKMPKDDEVIRFIKLLNGKTVAVKEKVKNLDDMYDIVEVAEPHGRLIDADKYDYPGDLTYEETVIDAEGE